MTCHKLLDIKMLDCQFQGRNSFFILDSISCPKAISTPGDGKGLVLRSPTDIVTNFREHFINFLIYRHTTPKKDRAVTSEAVKLRKKGFKVFWLAGKLFR